MYGDDDRDKFYVENKNDSKYERNLMYIMRMKASIFLSTVSKKAWSHDIISTASPTDLDI